MTRATLVDQDFNLDFKQIANEMNILKMEEKQRQKIKRIVHSGSDYQRIAYEMISSSKFQNTVMCCVFVNILLLIMPTMPQAPGVFFERLNNSMDVIDSIFLSVYVCEMVLKIYVYHTEYFKENWDLLDFVIVCFSFLDVGMGVSKTFASSSSAKAGGASALKATKLIRLLRATRMLRVLRTLKFIDRLQRYTVTILKSFKSLGAISRLTGSVIAIFAAIACSIFGELMPKRFGNMIMTIFTLLQLITLDDWYEIIQEGSVAHESLNIPLLLFIIAYIFLMVFIIFNLLIAVLVDNFQVSIEENRAKENHEKAQTCDVFEQLETLESDADEDSVSEEGGFLDGFLNDETKQKKELNEEEEFEDYFSNVGASQLMLLQWYYRILPAIEKQMFHYNDQMSSYERIIEEAITQSDEMFTTR